MNPIQIGISDFSVLHTDSDAPLSLEDKFKMVKSAGVFDYMDATPSAQNWQECADLAEKYDLPVLAGGWFYRLGQDDKLIEQNIEIGARLGSKIHNMQIFMDHADGHLLSDAEIAETYLRAYELGNKVGCLPSFEVHINNWSEDYRRVLSVADLVQRRGIPFQLTLDHSHVVFKINNPVEQQVCNIAEDIASGSLVLDPNQQGHICGEWIKAGIVAHMHLRSAAPNNPKNKWLHHPDINHLDSSQHPKDTIGRGILYPFIEPNEGEWHSPWDAALLQPWKKIVSEALTFNAQNKTNPFTTMTTEFIPFADYGGGAKFSIFENCCVCAVWVKGEIERIYASS